MSKNLLLVELTRNTVVPEAMITKNQEHLTGVVIKTCMLAVDVLELKISTEPQKVPYSAGQYFTLSRDGTVWKNYSSSNQDTGNMELTFHVRIHKNGSFTGTPFAIGNRIFLKGPYGNLGEHPRSASSPIIMIATSTGIAPIKCIIDEFIEVDRKSEIILYWGCKRNNDLYMRGYFDALSKANRCFRFVPVLSMEKRSDGTRYGHVQGALIEDDHDFSNAEVYICGSRAMITECVNVLRTKGVSETNIHCEHFISDSYVIPDDKKRKVGFNIRLGDGSWRNVNALYGETLISCFNRQDIPIQSICGGNCSCGTCRVELRSEQGAFITEKKRNEIRLLRFLGESRPGVRLACQIEVTNEMSGVFVTIL